MYSGTGIYSVQEASRLIGVPGRDIRRWLFGYHYLKTPGEASSRVYMAPLWASELANEDFDEDVLGFRDLLELRFIHEFAQHGVPMQVIRRCLKNATDLYGVSHPMTLPRFKTDGKTIYAEALYEEARDNSLVDLKSRQSVFKDIIRPSLYAGIVYAADGKQASKWYPGASRNRRSPIVIDPERQFGTPIIEKTGTPTSVIYASYLAEGASPDAHAVTARVYDVPPKDVGIAIRFEETLRRQLH